MKVTCHQKERELLPYKGERIQVSFVMENDDLRYQLILILFYGLLGLHEDSSFSEESDEEVVEHKKAAEKDNQEEIEDDKEESPEGEDDMEKNKKVSSSE